MRIPGFSSWTRGEPFVMAEYLRPPALGNWSTKDTPEHNARLVALMRERGIRRAYALHGAFNGLVDEPAGRMRSRWLDKERALIKSELPLEGYEIPPGGWALCPAAGCPFVVGAGWSLDGRLVVMAAHAGRDSLIDRGRIEGKPAREYEGVVYSMVEAYHRRDIGVHRLELSLFFSIAPEAFTHSFCDEKYGAFNQALFADVRSRWGERAAYEVALPGGERAAALSLPEIFLAQARGLHVAGARCYPCIPHGQGYASTRESDPRLAGSRRNLALFHNLYAGPKWGHA